MIEANEDYFKVHAWLIYHFGKANKCESLTCTSINPKRFEWAHIKGMPMIKDKASFRKLCPSCHRKYDFTESQRVKQKQSALGRTFSKETLVKLSNSLLDKNNVPVIQIDKFNHVITEFKSVKDASQKTKILKSGISNVLTNRAKTAGGFIWQYKQMN